MTEDTESKASEVLLGLYRSLSEGRMEDVYKYVSEDFIYVDPGKGKNLFGGEHKGVKAWTEKWLGVYGSGAVQLTQFDIRAAAQIPGTTTFFIYVNQAFTVTGSGKEWAGEVVSKVDVDPHKKRVIRVQSFYDTFSMHQAFE